MDFDLIVQNANLPDSLSGLAGVRQRSMGLPVRRSSQPQD